jgi:hypothetical protein
MVDTETQPGDWLELTEVKAREHPLKLDPAEPTIAQVFDKQPRVGINKTIVEYR